MPERGNCTPRNWLDAPHNRWSYWHVREMTRTATIRRGSGPVKPLPEALRPELAQVSYTFGDTVRTVAEGLEGNWGDGCLVIHDGRIVFEWYVDGAGPDDAHLVMSAAKSNTALQHLLDMRGGTRWDYHADEWDDMFVAGWVPHDRTELPNGTEAWIRSAENDMEHGVGPFRYCSLQTAVLGWVIERAGGDRFSDLFSRRIWSRIGAEHDADIVVDPMGFQGTNGTMSMTVRDWGRLGSMVLDGGGVDGEQVVPAWWLERLRRRDQALIDAYTATWGVDPASPDACYHDQWWITDPAAGIYSASGAAGQVMTIHHPSRSVIVNVSTFPTWLEADEFDHLWALQMAIADALTD
jgi:CubicO group peptidase (beta-lactamase class C family)